MSASLRRDSKALGYRTRSCERREIGRRAEEERAEAFFLCERRRSRRVPRAIARAARKLVELRNDQVEPEQHQQPGDAQQCVPE